jgi:hypothetical protein
MCSKNGCEEIWILALNKYLPHLIVIPEDDANRQIAVGFTLGCQTKQIRIENHCRGWSDTLDVFLRAHGNDMRLYQARYVVLIVDSDGQNERISSIRQQLPADIAQRVFVLGCFDEPENLKSEIGSFESIGKIIAKECIDGQHTIWQNKHLIHNIEELNRLKAQACDVLRS